MAPGQKQPGFWASLFGTDEGYAQDATYTRDNTVYDRTIGGGGVVISISLANVERDGERIMQIIERHNPIDIEERAASYGVATAAYDAPGAGVATDGQTIQLAEEQLQVGKRLVNRGTTRIRRYVVETPVEENLSLRQESVSVERRPVSGTATVAADAFTDKTIEVTEMQEQAVVGKTARVAEEVVVRKDVGERVETVRDTVRREKVDVEKVNDAGVQGAAGTDPLVATPGAKRTLGR
jgi:uncharacterized protein (TIGR02271 family)